MLVTGSNQRVEVDVLSQHLYGPLKILSWMKLALGAVPTGTDTRWRLEQELNKNIMAGASIERSFVDHGTKIWHPLIQQ
jgi:hypothetical protein